MISFAELILGLSLIGFLWWLSVMFDTNKAAVSESIKTPYIRRPDGTMTIVEDLKDGTRCDSEVYYFADADGKIPLAARVEGASSIQAVCPYCPYSAESVETLFLEDTLTRFTCRRCQRPFYAYY